MVAVVSGLVVVIVVKGLASPGCLRGGHVAGLLLVLLAGHCVWFFSLPFFFISSLGSLDVSGGLDREGERIGF